MPDSPIFKEPPYDLSTSTVPPPERAWVAGHRDAPADHENNFDLLRLVAAVLVVVGHVEYPYFSKNVDFFAELSGFQSLGGLGVSIFFVISGYLILQSRWRSSSLYIYGIKRIFRLVPGYGVNLFVVFMIAYPISGLSPQSYFISKQAFAFFLNVLIFPLNGCAAPLDNGYVYGCSLVGPTWTLIYEVLMYGVIAFTGYMYRSAQLFIYLFTICIILVSIMRDTLAPLGQWALNVDGISLFLFMPDRGVPLMGLFLAGALLNYVPKVVIMHPSTFVLSIILYIGAFHTSLMTLSLVQALTVPFFILSIGLRRSWLASLYHNIGDLSYGIYLYHWPIMTFVWTVLHRRVSPTSMTLVVAVSTTACAYLSYHFIERPAMQLVKRRSNTMRFKAV